MAIYPRSSIQNVNNRGFWIRKNESVAFLIKNQDDDLIDKIYLYVKHLNTPKYPVLIKKREDAKIKCFDDLKTFVAGSNTMDDIHNNIHDYYRTEKKFSWHHCKYYD